MKKNKKLIIFTDGGARGNPGLAAAGIYMKDNLGKEIVGFGKTLGVTTNNVAEYQAVILALNYVAKQHDMLDEYESIQFFMDSLLVCEQLNGRYKVKNERLRELLFQIRIKEQEVKVPIFYNHIRREMNKKADFFVNKSLDEELMDKNSQ